VAQVGYPRTVDGQVAVLDFAWCTQRCHQKRTETAPATRRHRVAETDSGGVTEDGQACHATVNGQDTGVRTLFHDHPARITRLCSLRVMSR
jgi:hypothetical protein